MKKLRMIVAFAIVLAIVGSAFTFNANKIGVFCYDTAPLTGTCDAIVVGAFIDPTNGTTFKYYNGWDGNHLTCTGNTNCTSSVKISLPN
jgi:hypothetical protein